MRLLRDPKEKTTEDPRSHTMRLDADKGSRAASTSGGEKVSPSLGGNPDSSEKDIVDGVS